MKQYAREFAFWRGEVKTRPEILPATFSTASLCSFDIEIDARRWQLRCALVAVRGAGVGVADVKLERQEIAVGVDRSISDAEGTLRTAQFTEGEENAEQQGVVVVAYDNTPTAAEKAAVDRCVAAAAE